jgi:hypothetical protein
MSSRLAACGPSGAAAILCGVRVAGRALNGLLIGLGGALFGLFLGQKTLQRFAFGGGGVLR